MATSRRSLAMERTGQWVSTQDIPTDVVVVVGDATFPLHKFMLVAKSGLMRSKIVDSASPDVSRIVLSDLPGGAEAFEKASNFCYGINFEITVHNVVALRCASEHLQMTEDYCKSNLVGRTEEFLQKAALTNLAGAVAVLSSCEGFLPLAQKLNIVHRAVNAISLKARNESTFPTRSPPDWWVSELASLPVSFLHQTLTTMQTLAAEPQTLATTFTTIAHRSLLLPSPPSQTLINAIASLLVSTPIPLSLLCYLHRVATTIQRRDLEARIAVAFDDASVEDLLTIGDVESVRRVVEGFVGKSNGVDGLVKMRKVARILDLFVGEIAVDEGISVSSFVGIIGALPKDARRFDDDVYRAIDIFLKAHPLLDEIEREKVCSIMDPLKLSYEARLHASQNKRLPVQIVLQCLYYDQLKLRSGSVDAYDALDGAASMRSHIKADASLAQENAVLRSELSKMKLYLSQLQKDPSSSPVKAVANKKPKFFSSMKKTLGKLNPFRQGSKDTSNMDELVEVPKPRRRRFSMS